MTLKDAGLGIAVSLIAAIGLYGLASLHAPEPKNGYIGVKFAYVSAKLMHIYPVAAQVSLKDCRRALSDTEASVGPLPPYAALVGKCIAIPDSPVATSSAPAAPRVAGPGSKDTSV